MYSKRGGRVQVNMMQFHELVERVDKLEAENKPKEVEQKPIKLEKPTDGENVLTKNKVMALLDKKGIKYDNRKRKDVLIELLNKEVETCQEDQTESD